MDGEIVALPDPIKYVSTRPSLNPSYAARALDAEYFKAVYLTDFAHNVNIATALTSASAAADAARRYRLDLDVSGLEFEYHRLFSTEHVLSFRLRAMCKHFKITEEQNLVEILTEKVRICHKCVNSCNESEVTDTLPAANQCRYRKF